MHGCTSRRRRRQSTSCVRVGSRSFRSTMIWAWPRPKPSAPATTFWRGSKRQSPQARGGMPYPRSAFTLQTRLAGEGWSKQLSRSSGSLGRRDVEDGTFGPLSLGASARRIGGWITRGKPSLEDHPWKTALDQRAPGRTRGRPCAGSGARPSWIEQRPPRPPSSRRLQEPAFRLREQWVHHAPDQRQPSDAARETHVAGGGQVVSRAASVSADKWRSAGPTSSGLTWRHYFPFQIQELVISEAIRHHKRFPTIKHGSQGHIEFRYPGYRNRTPRCYQVGGHEYLKGLGLHITHHLFKPSGRIPHY